MSLLPASNAAAAVVGYPTPAATGFHHLGLVYHNPQRTADDLTSWVAEYQDGVPVRNRWMFDSFLTLDLHAPSGTATDTGPTVAGDWNALLDRWLGTGGTIAGIDAAITKVAAAKASDGAPMGQPPTRRKIVVAIPWPDATQGNFGMVNGVPADLRKPADRDRVTAWYMDQVKSRFATAGYRNVDLWGVYLMREDILQSDEAWVTHTTAAAHQRGLKVAWVPYYVAPGWQKWRSFGLDVAIMQPSYGFRSPADGGQVNASRLAATAKQAAEYGLGVEVEARGAAGSDYEAAMFQQYLSEGARLGYRDAATAYFLGFDRRPTLRDDSYRALASYLNRGTPRSVDTAPNWLWTSSGDRRTAFATFTARGDLTAIRVDLASGSAGWWGTVQVGQYAGGWQTSGVTYTGGPSSLDGAYQSVLVPLTHNPAVTALSILFIPGPGLGAVPVTVDQIVLDPVWPTGSPSIAAGATYTVSAAPLPGNANFADSTPATTAGYGTGKLTDGRWSTTGWWEAQPLGWLDPAPARVVFDLGIARSVDKAVLYTHSANDASVNWPAQSGMYLTRDCPLLTPAVRGTPACPATPLRAGAPVVLANNGNSRNSYDGTVTFTAPPAPHGRYLTMVVQPTGWFLADEVRIFSAGVDITSSVTYRLLTPPSPPTHPTTGFADNGIRLTDGNVAPIMSNPAVTGWHANVVSHITVDLGRTVPVSSATAWFADHRDWGVVLPPMVVAATSTDGIAWTPLGSTAKADRSWYASHAMTVTGTSRTARYVQFTVPPNTQQPNAWHMVSEVEVAPPARTI